MPENIDATQNSSSALTAAIASSPEVTEELQQAQGTETPTPQQGENQEQKETPFHEHPRFKELIEERNWYRQQLERVNQPQTQPIPQQPTTDPYAGMTPEEERFWRMQRQIAREEATKVTQEQLGQIRPVIDAGRAELATIKVAQFRRDHPDVQANSQEENAIAERISMGYPPEDAYRIVMWDKKVGEVEGVKHTKAKQQMETKKQANVETRSMPVNNSLPINSKVPLAERIRQNYEKIERGEI